MLDLESEGPGSMPTRGKFYNPNLHNIARSDSLGFKTKNPNGHYGILMLSQLHHVNPIKDISCDDKTAMPIATCEQTLKARNVYLKTHNIVVVWCSLLMILQNFVYIF